MVLAFTSRGRYPVRTSGVDHTAIKYVMKIHLILVPFLAIGRLFESQPIESTHVNILRQNSNFDRNTSWHEHEHNHNIPPRRNTSLDIAFSNRQNRSSSVIKEQPRQVPTPALYQRQGHDTKGP